jgi:nicotinamide riboside transporter PnuC
MLRVILFGVTVHTKYVIHGRVDYFSICALGDILSVIIHTRTNTRLMQMDL